MSNTDTDLSSVDALLDMNLDDLKDLPDFKPFNAGTHIVTLKWERKVVNKNPCVELGLKLVETVEQTDTTAAPNAVGSETSILYQLANEISQGKLKQVMVTLSKATGQTQMSAIIEASNGMTVKAVTSLRADKTDPTKVYGDLKSIEVV